MRYVSVSSVCVCFCLGLTLLSSFFQADDREWLYNKTEKVFFIHNPGPDSEKCLVARPNTGKRLEYKSSLNKKFSNGAFTSNPISVQRAMEVWKTEYELADIPYSEKYQFSCPGRHRDEYVVSIPIIWTVM